jgi:hypothetical protein
MKFKYDPAEIIPDLGYIVIELMEYLGDDMWRYENRGTASVSSVDSKTFKTLHTMSGKTIFNEYEKIGESTDKALMKRFADDYKANMDGIDV